jgi:hypothetical protein
MNFLGTSERRGASVHRGHLRLLRGGQRQDRDDGPRAEREDGPVEASHTRSEPVQAQSESAQAQKSAQAQRGSEQAQSQTRAERSRILIAGADPERRAAVRADLTEALPAETQFGEAAAAWEVLEQAPSSGVVMLAGDLDEVTAESLMNVLGHRHPSLPVVALGLFAGGGVADGPHASRAASFAG